MTDSNVRRTEFIDAMRRVACSVSVVTTDGMAGRYGATVSAFCSVSADPPTVLVCLNASSRIAQHVRENGMFTLNVLAQDARHVAMRFAGMHDAEVADRFEGVDADLAGATALRCDLVQVTEQATHLICIGAVQEVSLGSDQPLTYLGGRYGTVTGQEEAA